MHSFAFQYDLSFYCQKKKVKSHFIAQYVYMTKTLQCNTVVSSYLIVIGMSVPLLMDRLTDTVRMF